MDRVYFAVALILCEACTGLESTRILLRLSTGLLYKARWSVAKCWQTFGLDPGDHTVTHGPAIPPV